MTTISVRRRALAGATAAILVLAACGDDDDETTDTTAAGATEAPTLPPRPRRPRPRPPRRRARRPRRGRDHRRAGGAAGGEVELAAGDVFVTGSSTVEPISIRVGELANEMSGGELAVTVEGPGTGDGFATFCGGGADVSDASRPINDEEIALCEENGVEYVELEVAIDGLTVATNPANEAITCLDVPALYALVGPESEGTANWSDTAALATEVSSAYADVTSPMRRSTSTAPVRRAGRTTRSSSSPSPTSPRSAARKSKREPTTRRAPTTTSSSRASRARSHRWAGSASPSTPPSRSA